MQHNSSRQKSLGRRAAIVEFLVANPGAKKKDIASAVGIVYRTASTLLGALKHSGQIYATGTNHNVRYWKADGPIVDTNEAEPEPEPAMPASAVGRGMVFLSRRRPSGINTVFEECRHNSAMLLPVLQVMARRRNAQDMVSSK